LWQARELEGALAALQQLASRIGAEMTDVRAALTAREAELAAETARAAALQTRADALAVALAAEQARAAAAAQRAESAQMRAEDEREAARAMLRGVRARGGSGGAAATGALGYVVLEQAAIERLRARTSEAESVAEVLRSELQSTQVLFFLFLLLGCLTVTCRRRCGRNRRRIRTNSRSCTS
jgi:hypothetical protein